MMNDVTAPWWRSAVVYQIYPRSWADADGDGIGDLPGIIARLPYLRDLGVDAVWLSPFYTSPQADAGYDVADYYDVDPLFGSLTDAETLIDTAHDLGLRLIVDLVPNHTSSEHAWFQEALADPTSHARDRYVFRNGIGDGPPNIWQSVFGGPAWTRESLDGQWYLHLFDPGQPDLEWTNPEVHAQFLRILAFWLDRGVDGFRIDVAHALYKDPGLTDLPADQVRDGSFGMSPLMWDRDEVLGVYEDWRALLDTYDGDRMLVGEVFLFDVARVARYVGPTRLHQAFNFTVMRAPFEAAALRETVEAALKLFDPSTWVLSNHDLVRHVTRYGGGALGRRRGLAVTALLLALPGSPYLYQGEELGLEESDVPADRREDPIFLRTDGAEAGRDGCRTPIPWTGDEPGHGFTTGEPWLPFGDDATALAVERQQGDPDSTLSAYRRLLAARRDLLASGPGDDVSFADSSDDVLVLRRGPITVVLSAAGEAVEVPVEARELLVATAEGACLTDGVLTVPACSTVWVR